MAAAGREAAQDLIGTVSGRTVLGRGAGGDRTLRLDQVCEDAILQALREHAPAPYSLVSEEAGMSGPADAPWRVVVDPLDGSLNAKRGLEPFAASIAIADGQALGDVKVAVVEDYTRPRVFGAVRGEGLVPVGDSPFHERPTAGAVGDCRRQGDLVEIVLIEAGGPEGHHFRYRELSTLGAEGCSRDMRVRQIGSLALALCLVAAGTADMLLAAVRSRAVDLAAGLLILRESGGGAVTLDGGDLLRQPLDLERRSPFLAWRAGLDGEEILRRSAGLRHGLIGDAT
jgi:myo-inositol-1(or 4)-monophosphatase